MEHKNIIALYIRLSIEDSKIQSLSINNQRIELRKHAKMLFNNEYDIMEFVDNGYTGTNFERPAVQKLLELVKNYKVNCIIVKDFSRFGRNFIETSYFIEKVFPLFHVRFISLNNNFDNIECVESSMQVAFQQLINEYYSKDLSIKSKTAKYAKMRKGEYQSSICCYGYKKEANNRLSFDKEAAEVVKMIFNMSLNGMSNNKIAIELYKQAILTPGEYKVKNGNNRYDISKCNRIWTSSTISRILADERYIGTYIIGKHEVKEVGSKKVKLKNEKDWIKISNNHPPIISEADFKEVQKIRRTFKILKKNKKEYPLRSKVICGCCKYTMSRLDRKSPLFYCRYGNINEKSMCYNLNILEKDLHTILFNIVTKQVTTVLGISELNTIDHLEADEPIAYKNLIEQYYNRKIKLYEQYQSKEIDLQSYKKLNTSYDDNLTELKNMYSNASLKTEMIKKQQSEKEKLLKIANIVKDQDCLNNTITNLLINKVLIYPNNHIEIEWSIKDFGLIAEYNF